jgi:hypothetical protein
MLGGNEQRAAFGAEAWLRSETIARGLATRARIVLASANGESIRELAERLELTDGKPGTYAITSRQPIAAKGKITRAAENRHLQTPALFDDRPTSLGATTGVCLAFFSVLPSASS